MFVTELSRIFYYVIFNELVNTTHDGEPFVIIVHCLDEYNTLLGQC